VGIVAPVLVAAERGLDSAPLHLLKMAVGVADLDELRRIREQRRAERGGDWVYTRNRPRRAEAVLGGGSIYWVIRGQVRVRQRVIGFRAERDENGRAYCLIEVAPELVVTESRPWRAFQGWRYLSVADAPRDLGSSGAITGEPPPAAMLAELRALGLI
jgi:hypothetical protein